MDKYIKQISLLFENCEYADIPSSDINNIVIDGINRRIQRTAINAISDIALADNCYIELLPHAKNIRYGFNENCLNEPGSPDLFQRIDIFRDITGIQLHYTDGSEETLYPVYEDEVEGALGSPNKNQKQYINPYGQMFILISKTKDFSDYIDPEDINDESYVRHAEQFYS